MLLKEQLDLKPKTLKEIERLAELEGRTPNQVVRDALNDRYRLLVADQLKIRHIALEDKRDGK